jgi:hypothetical protein
MYIEKQCSMCLMFLPLNKFAVSKHGTYGRDTYCRKCRCIRREKAKYSNGKVYKCDCGKELPSYYSLLNHGDRCEVIAARDKE